MGTVYRVEQTMMHTSMAMKVLRPELSNTEEMEKRFEREARASARLDSPHIVRANDFGRAEDGTLFLVMELIEGETLMRRIARKKLDVEEALEITAQILDGLAHAHAHDVIHRDLKPGNIMLVGADPPVVKILDFGLAKLLAGDDSRLTQVGMVYGTARYMSPEQASAGEIDHRSDLYSVGVILYLLLTGHPPFEGSESEILRAHLGQPPPPLGLSIGDTEREAAIERLVRKALAKAPEARFQDATELRAAVLGARSGKARDTRLRSLPSLRASLARVLGARSGKARDTRLRSLPSLRASLARVLGARSGKARDTRLRSLPSLRASLARVLGGRGRLLVAGGLAVVIALGVRWGFVAWSNGRVVASRVAEGHGAFERRDYAGAASAFADALRADRDAIEDPVLAGDARRLLDADRREGQRLLDLIARTCDDDAAPFLAGVVETAEPQAARTAFQALQDLGELDRVDAVGALLDGLEHTRASDCETRRWYVLHLGELRDDRRILPALQKEQQKKAGFLIFKTDANRCMKPELDRLIEDLQD